MDNLSSQEITALLHAWNGGDQTALERLMPLVYGELHRLAQRYMHGEQGGNTLQTTALVNEAYLRLLDASRVEWQSRAHFFAIAARLMRQILVDFARERRAVKHGGAVQPVSLEQAAVISRALNEDFMALDEALHELSKLDPRKCQIVEMRFFAGMTEEEIATALKLSTDTVRRDWRLAKAWLLSQLTAGHPHNGSP